MEFSRFFFINSRWNKNPVSACESPIVIPEALLSSRQMETLQQPHRRALKYDLHTKQRAGEHCRADSQQPVDIRKIQVYLALTLSGSVKHGKDGEKGQVNFLRIIPEKLNIWPVFEYMTIYQPLLYYLITRNHLFSLIREETKRFNSDFSSFSHFQVTYFRKIKIRVMLSDPLFSSSRKHHFLTLGHRSKRVTHLERRHTTSRKKPRSQTLVPGGWLAPQVISRWQNFWASDGAWGMDFENAGSRIQC